MTHSIKTASCAILGLALLLPGEGAAQVAPASSTGLTISGFISATMYAQNQPFGLFTQGQAANTAPPVERTEDRWFHGGDVRNTRLSLRFFREQDDDWITSATFEVDLFGGFASNEPFGDEMPIPRLRLAYADLSNGTTTLRIGQMWSPSFGAVPNSLSHIAFPLGYGSGGVIGWRFPGIAVHHTLASGEDGPLTRLQVAALAGSWSHVTGGAGPTFPSAGEAGLFPQLEARLDVAGEAEFGAWNAYVVGHIDQKDPDGIGVDGGQDPLTGTALEVGGKVVPGPVTLQGNLYYGQAVGQLLAAITQVGDYDGVGGWAQIGYRLSDRVSLWAFGGMDDARDGGATLPVGARDKNQILSAMFRYDLPGYSMGLEWLNANTDFVGVAESTSATQISVSVFYAF
ncbi:MAG: hypothetical protein R3314_08740 [Longimicrobiales bacterium]|nr:hypothetical protein [Longimicrobiales bacterium]